jgi:hypothetical protein
VDGSTRKFSIMFIEREVMTGEREEEKEREKQRRMKRR